MPEKLVFQPDFRISDRARDRILVLTRQCRDEKHAEVVPCLSMMLKRDNDWLPESVPVVGFYEQDEVEQGDIATVDGLSFVFAVGHEGAAAFAGKTLTYDEGGFRLI